ncbi:hypothetical protein GDO78_003452, partial [Eleutherodactylus coqui]
MASAGSGQANEGQKMHLNLKVKNTPLLLTIQPPTEHTGGPESRGDADWGKPCAEPGSPTEDEAADSEMIFENGHFALDKVRDYNSHPQVTENGTRQPVKSQSETNDIAVI